MNKLITAVTLCMCLALASANPKKFKLDAGLLCVPTCEGSCDVLKEACIDIPNVIDCAAQVADCEARCVVIKDCAAKCPSECSQDCSTKGTDFEKSLCQKQVGACVYVCQAKCPIDVITQKIVVDIQAILGKIAMLINTIIEPQNNPLALLAGPDPLSIFFPPSGSSSSGEK